MADRGFKLKGKVALITGASGGIGAATAKLFTELGATVSLLDIEAENLATVVAECKQLSVGQPEPLIFVGNIGDVELRQKYVDDTVKRFGKLDILVNNAGTTKLTYLLTSSLEDYDDIFDINVRALVHLTKLAAPHLIKTKGSVINLSSVAGQRVVEGRLFYGMSKATVKHFTQYAAQELGKYHVRVNSISPGMVKTNILLRYGIKKEDLHQYFEETGKKQALLRCGEAREIAEMIAFLGSEESSFVTGADILVDGGQTVQPSVMANVTGK